MVTQVDFLQQMLAPSVEGFVGTAPQIFIASSDQTNAVLTTAGALSTLIADGICKVDDIFFVNGDQDGTPFSNVYIATATSSGSLIPYPSAVGGALLAANNLSDVASVPASRNSLGLGTAQNVVFANVQAGASGTAGTLRSYPSAATSGYLGLTGVANSGDFSVVISNASHGQSTVYSISDVGASTGQFLIKTAALVSGNFPMASGTAGKVVDSGYGANNIQLYASVAITAAQFNGMYAAPFVLIAAPGANNLIVVDRCELVMTFVSAAYAAGGVVALQYDSTVHGAGVNASNAEAAADFFAAASSSFLFNGVSGNTVGVVPFSTSVNKGLYISNLTQAFTTGDSTWVAKIHYRIVAVA